jgi:XTP/dITP diphosphohydrolase
VQATWSGAIGFAVKGEEGFGYDPIFVKNGMNQTFAEIDAVFKHQISHRAEAFLQLENWLKKNYNIFD